jgi:glycosyltransferase involved in cell wall biosynthesis
MERDKIKVMHLRSSTENGGGPEKTILNSPLYVDKSRFQLAIVYLKKRADNKFRIAQRAQELGLGDFYVVEEGSYFDRHAMGKVGNLIDHFGADILHTHDFKSDWWGWLLRKHRPNLSLVTTLHGWVTMGNFRVRLYYQMGKLPLYFFDQIIGVNGEIVRSLRRIGVPQEKMVIIHNAIDSNIYRRQAAKHNDGEKWTIGYIGRLSNEKGVEDLIQAFVKLSKDERIGKLLIAGEGPRFEDLRLLVSELNLFNQVEFLGYVDSKAFFSRVDIFVNPTLREGLPNTILESMSMQTAVIATKVGGVGDLLKHGQTGLIIPTRNPDKICEMVNVLLDSPSEYHKVTKNAREMICNEYDFTKRMRRVEEVYNGVLENKNWKRNLASSKRS